MKQKLQQATTFYQKGRLAEGQILCEEILKVQPRHLDTLQLLAAIAYQSKDLNKTVEVINKVIEIIPNSAELYNDRGLLLQELNRLDAALESYEKAIAIKPTFAQAYNNRGLALRELKQLDGAVASYNQAIALKSDYAKAYYNRGLALQELKQLDGAVASFSQAIALKSDYAEAYIKLGNVLQDLYRLDAAVVCYEKAIAIKPDYAEAYGNRGNALFHLRHYQAALESYDKAIFINSHYEDELLYGMRLNLKMQICDWKDSEKQVEELVQKIQGNKTVSQPFSFLAVSTSLPLQRKVAEILVHEKHPANTSLGEIKKYPRHEKIRIGYFSMDFRDHPLAFLTAELFETHDRNRFEIIAFSFGPDTQDEMRHRLEGAFDKFIDVKDESDQKIAEMARLMEIDIAIDLAGYTTNSRTGIFAMRAAPIQINYLGYPGTMGADYIDYLIADKHLIPEESKAHYSEKIVFLPFFQANDRKRKIADKVFTRKELGLPESGFVFCCFNNNYKITPNTFDGWIRILKRVGGSVLWLLEDNFIAANNLQKEAEKRGVDAKRLVFAKRLPAPEYLARYRCADLFLDTLPFNAGTTASDALWAGLPLLTCTGEAFASRMAGSLLTAIGVPELIVQTQGEYEDLAVELAINPELLKAIKQKLERNRLATPLFDIKSFTGHIENAYMLIYERYQADLPPDHIYVESK